MGKFKNRKGGQREYRTPADIAADSNDDSCNTEINATQSGVGLYMWEFGQNDPKR